MEKLIILDVNVDYVEDSPFPTIKCTESSVSQMHFCLWVRLVVVTVLESECKVVWCYNCVSSCIILLLHVNTLKMIVKINQLMYY